MPKRKKINLVIDANWFISACINKNSRAILFRQILKNAHLQVFYSAELLAEVDGVMSRKKFAKIINKHQVSRFSALVLAFMQKTVIGPVETISRDGDDDYLLAICQACQADFLITGDQDLLVLGTHRQTTILTMSQFLQLLPFLK
ncbi:putative toxin-antitoxin system toxin component, PIN family [Fibrella forsythiae]|uniref:Toxin-antitoxin system toxin component, PIN family n=1 Tax=Fibrella forsythiae TaxID=2817061 RepID=A0ABS3JT47_9BACT|nr:putative toxin-antitoxin system toxin component, PIN family [Fibrella forsythiae]MBO0953184.1 putative toxin-antitoxin system toxin component, PIN family [Fibrella forsythiae]